MTQGYTELKRYFGDPKCGDHIILQDPSSAKLVLKKMYGTNDDKKAETILEKTEERLQNISKHIIECLDYEVKVESQLCSKFFTFNVFFEYPLYDLKLLLKARMNEQKPFFHEELMFIFYHSLEALCYYQNYKGGNGFLQLDKLFYDLDNSLYKLCDNFHSLPLEQQYMNIFYTNDGYSIFPPEIFEKMKIGTAMTLNKPKLDTFNLGMILLCLGNLVKPNDLYDYTSPKMGGFTFQKNIDEFKKNFKKKNPLLVEIVLKLLVLDEKDRFTPVLARNEFPAYSAWLKVYEKNKKIVKNQPNANFSYMDNFISLNRNSIANDAINNSYVAKGQQGNFFDMV